jgi:hypothetical protein
MERSGMIIVGKLCDDVTREYSMGDLIDERPLSRFQMLVIAGVRRWLIPVDTGNYTHPGALRF